MKNEADTKHKYLKGEHIHTLNELEINPREFYYMGDKPVHISFLKSMQYRTVVNMIQLGRLSYAIKNKNYIDNTQRTFKENFGEYLKRTQDKHPDSV